MRRFFNILDNNNNRTDTFITLQNAREDIIGELDAILSEAELARKGEADGHTYYVMGV